MRQVLDIRRDLFAGDDTHLTLKPTTEYRTQVGKSCKVGSTSAKPDQIVHIASLQATELFAQHDSVSVSFVHEHLLRVAAHFQMKALDCDVQAHSSLCETADGRESDEQWYFSARLAFASKADASSAFSWLSSWKTLHPLPSMHLTLGRARSTLKFAFISLVRKVIPALLQKAAVPPPGSDPISLFLAIWFDNCDAVTACMIWLVDPAEMFFKEGTSLWELVQLFVGGEELIKVCSAELLDELEKCFELGYLCKGRATHIEPKFIVCDHHAAQSIGATTGGTSRHRGPYDISDARFFGLVAYHCQVIDSTVAFQTKQYEGLCEFLEEKRAARDRVQELGLEQVAHSTEMDHALSIGTCIWKKVMSQPMFANARNGSLLGMINIPPPMHCLSGCLRIIFGLLLKWVIPPSFTSRAKWEAELKLCSTYTSTGKFVASFAKYRQVFSSFVHTCGADLQLLFPYSAAARLFCHVIRIVYHPNGSTPAMRLGLRVTTMLSWLMTSATDLYFGASGSKEKKETSNSTAFRLKLVTDTNYWHSLHILCDLADQLCIPLRWLLEERGEQNFTWHQFCTGLLRSKTNISSELLLREINQIRATVANEAPRSRSGHRPGAQTDVKSSDFVVCSCVVRHQVPLRSFDKKTKTWNTKRTLPLFPYNMRAMFRRIHQLPELADRSFLLPSGHYLFCCSHEHPKFDTCTTSADVICVCGQCSPEKDVGMNFLRVCTHSGFETDDVQSFRAFSFRSLVAFVLWSRICVVFKHFLLVFSLGHVS